MLSLVDTHCHLDFDAFDDDRDEVISRARQAGIRRILNPGIDTQSSREALSLSERYDEVYTACGVHPNDALTWDDRTLGILRQLAGQPKVVAIGEIGLDYYRDRAPRELQREIFHKQLLLAEELSLPVVIHSRAAMHDILEMLAVWHQRLVIDGSALVERPGVLHSFSGDRVDAEKVIELGFYIGVTGPVTYPNAVELRQTLSTVPISSLLVETDAPFLTPQPHRGERNEPAHVSHTAQKIAELHSLATEVVAEQTSANSKLLFKW